jgi:hypothetical protein
MNKRCERKKRGNIIFIPAVKIYKKIGGKMRERKIFLIIIFLNKQGKILKHFNFFLLHPPHTCNS